MQAVCKLAVHSFTQVHWSLTEIKTNRQTLQSLELSTLRALLLWSSTLPPREVSALSKVSVPEPGWDSQARAVLNLGTPQLSFKTCLNPYTTLKNTGILWLLFPHSLTVSVPTDFWRAGGKKKRKKSIHCHKWNKPPTKWVFSISFLITMQNSWLLSLKKKGFSCKRTIITLSKEFIPLTTHPEF